MSEYNIYANFNNEKVTVYQAFNDNIGNYINEYSELGEGFSIGRMTWIKPSFLWMMYRSDWGRKDKQTRIFKIDIYEEAFSHIIRKSVLSNYEPLIYKSNEDWKEKIKEASVICQFDPAKDMEGNNLNSSAIQLGMRKEEIRKYKNEYILGLEEITGELGTIRGNIELVDMIIGEERYYGNYIDMKQQCLSEHAMEL